MRAIALTALLALALTGCHQRDEQRDVVVENESDFVVPAEPANGVVAPLPEPVNAANTAVRAAPPPPVDESVQTRDDADASGMTARLPDAERDEPVTTPAANRSETK